MPNKQTPSSVANSAVRAVLTAVSTEMLQRELVAVPTQTPLEFFNYCCAYTGTDLRGALPHQIHLDHAVAHNRQYGGLNLPGNLVPCTPEANIEKSGQHYADYLTKSQKPLISNATPDERRTRLARIEEWRRLTGYAAAEAMVVSLQSLLPFVYDSVKSYVEVAIDHTTATLPAPAPTVVPPADEAAAEAALTQLQDTLASSATDTDTADAAGSSLLPARYRSLFHSGARPGSLACQVFEQLKADGQLASRLADLQDGTVSRRDFGLAFPALSPVRNDGNRARYYASAIRVGITDYYLSNHWYDLNAVRLEEWLGGLELQ